MAIYLDFAAATPLDAQVEQAMRPYLKNAFFNPSADYLAARKVKKDISAARARVAAILGAKPSEIIFTAGGSEANNLAIKGVMDLYPKSNVVVSAIEHESVLAPARNYESREVSVSHDGLIDLEHLSRQIDDRTVLVSIMYANNEVGTIQPLRQVARLIEQIRNERLKAGNNALPLLLHSDACQAANFLDLHVSRLKVDLMSLNGGKIYGPKQSGVLYARSGLKLKPLIEGGGQEANLRSGTENVAGIIGFATALSIAQENRQIESLREAQIRDYFAAALSELFGAKIKINGSTKSRLPNNLHVTFQGKDNETLLIGLDQAGIMAASGSACSAAKNVVASHVLLAMGLSEAEARSSLRFSLGRTSTRAQIERTVRVLAALR